MSDRVQIRDTMRAALEREDREAWSAAFAKYLDTFPPSVLAKVPSIIKRCAQERRRELESEC